MWYVMFNNSFLPASKQDRKITPTLISQFLGYPWNCLDDIAAVVLPKPFLSSLVIPLWLESFHYRRRRQPSSPDREITTQLFFDFIQGLSLASCSCSSSVWLQEWLFAKKRCIFCLFSLLYLYVHVQQYKYRSWTPLLARLWTEKGQISTNLNAPSPLVTFASRFLVQHSGVVTDLILQFCHWGDGIQLQLCPTKIYQGIGIVYTISVSGGPRDRHCSVVNPQITL